jgi:hypothetical protein
MPPHHKRGGATQSKIIIPANSILSIEEVQKLCEEFPNYTTQEFQALLNKHLSMTSNPPPPPDELMATPESSVPQKCSAPLKMPPNPTFNWSEHCPAPKDTVMDTLPPADAPHPPSPLPPFE